MVLLHLLSNYIHANKLVAIHINHGLQDEASSWNSFCRNQAEKYNIPYQSFNANLNNAVSNIEELARKERYRIFAEQMSENDILLTAHHRDDQAETLLLQLMRGAGVDGLSAMPEVADFHQGQLLRPLLPFPRTELESYANEYQLPWVEDPSNTDNRFDRNYLRNNVLPLLEKRWPAASSNISRSAINCREAAELVQVKSSEDLGHCLGKYQHTLSIKELNQFSLARKHFIIRSWLQTNKATLPDRNKVEKICTEMIQAREDAQPLISWSNLELQRFNDFLYLLKPIQEQQPEEIMITRRDIENGYTELPGPAGKLVIKLGEGTEDQNLPRLSVRFRAKGESVELFNRPGRRKLKKLFQEWNIPPWMRDFVPLLYCNHQCVAVADFAVCAEAGDTMVRVSSWQPEAAYEWR